MSPVQENVELVIITGIDVEKDYIFLTSIANDSEQTYIAEHEEALAFHSAFNDTIAKGLFLLAEYDSNEKVLIHDMD